MAQTNRYYNFFPRVSKLREKKMLGEGGNQQELWEADKVRMVQSDVSTNQLYCLHINYNNLLVRLCQDHILTLVFVVH